MENTVEKLIKKIHYNIEIGAYEENVDLLDPNKSALMYKHIKQKLQILPKRYAIKVVNKYFPRLFNTRTDALFFAETANEDKLTDPKEKVFIYLTKFEMFSIEEI